MSWWTEPICEIPIDSIWNCAFGAWLLTKAVSATYIQYCYQGCKSHTDENEEDDYKAVRTNLGDGTFTEHYVKKPESWREQRDARVWFWNFAIYPDIYVVVVPMFCLLNVIIQQWDWVSLLPKDVRTYRHRLELERNQRKQAEHRLSRHKWRK